MLGIFVLVLIGYLLGSIPFGLIIGKGIKGIDIRDIGSGNIGTANAIRALGPFWGGMVFAGDVLKGVLPVILAVWLGKTFPGTIPAAATPYCHVLAGLASIIGHNNSLFLNFKGGKGIATSFGVFIALDWRPALIGFLIWGLTVIITKYSSLGSLLGALSLPISMIILKQPLPYAIFAAAATVLAFYKHRENIQRLLKGEEKKITDKPDKKEGNSEEKSGKIPQTASANEG